MVNYLNATLTDANAVSGGIDYNNYLTKVTLPRRSRFAFAC